MEGFVGEHIQVMLADVDACCCVITMLPQQSSCLRRGLRFISTTQVLTKHDSKYHVIFK